MSLEPIGFWSYTRDDDARSRGRLSQLRTLLADEVQGHIGRAERVHIFQDVATIPYGTTWETEIANALDGCSFFIPIVTPGFLQSEMCCREVMRFRQREIALGRNDLIFPIRYIDVEEVDPDRPGSVFDRAVWDCLRSRQQIDFRQLRLLPPESTVEVALKLEQVARAIVAALRRPAPAELRSTTVTPAPSPTVAPPTATDPPAQAPVVPDKAPLAAIASGAEPGTAGAIEATAPTRSGLRLAIWGGAGVVALSLALVAVLRQPPLPPRPDQQVGTAPATTASSASRPTATEPSPPAHQTATAPATVGSSAMPPAATVPPLTGLPPSAPPGSVMRDCPTCPEMVLIPHGSFTMGVPKEESNREKFDDSNSRPLHRVTIARDFYLGKYTVTKAEFAAFIAKTGWRRAGDCWTFEADKDGKWSGSVQIQSRLAKPRLHADRS